MEHADAKPEGPVGHWQLLRAEPAFGRLLLASLISGIGDWFSNVAVFTVLLTLTGSGMAVGITLALRVLPYLVVGPLGGLLADRVPRKVIMVSADLGRVVLALLYLLATSADRVWLIYASTLGLVLLSTFYNPARQASVAQLVRPRHLLAATSLEESAFGSRMLVGSLLGGIAAAAWGPQIAFVINAASFLLSALVTLTIRFPALAHPEQAATAPRPAPGEKEATSWSIVRRSRLVQAILMLNVLWPIGGGIVNVLLSIYAFQVFHAGSFGTGVIYGALGVGFIIGGSLTRYTTGRVRQAAAVGFILEGAGHLLTAVSPNLAVAAVSLAVATIGGGVGNACVNALVMEAVPGHQQGRVFGLMGSLSNGVMGATMLLGGSLLAICPPRLLGVAGGVLVLAAAAIFGPLLMRTEVRPLTSRAAR